MRVREKWSNREVNKNRLSVIFWEYPWIIAYENCKAKVQKCLNQWLHDHKIYRKSPRWQICMKTTSGNYDKIHICYKIVQ